MLKTLRMPALLLLIGVLVCMVLAPPVAAQEEEEGIVWGRPWWVNALSLVASMFALIGIAVAVFELGAKHRLFWVINIMTALLVVGGALLVEVGSPFFLLAVILGITLVAVDLILLLAEATIKKLTGS